MTAWIRTRASNTPDENNQVSNVHDVIEGQADGPDKVHATYPNHDSAQLHVNHINNQVEGEFVNPYEEAVEEKSREELDDNRSPDVEI